jgi:hypothetical protein
MHIAIVAVLNEVRMFGEGVIFAMFENENSAFAQTIFCKNAVGNSGDFWHLVRRIGKNQVEHFVVYIEKTEHIAAVDTQVVDFEVGSRFFDEGDVPFAHLHATHMQAAARHALETDASRARKEIERGGAVEVDVARKHIEKALFGKIGRWARRDVAWRREMSTAKFSTYNPHISDFKFQISPDFCYARQNKRV